MAARIAAAAREHEIGRLIRSAGRSRREVIEVQLSARAHRGRTAVHARVTVPRFDSPGQFTEALAHTLSVWPYRVLCSRCHESDTNISRDTRQVFF